MKSIAETFIAGHGIKAGFRPAATEGVFISLLCTLSKHGLLQEAVDLINETTGDTFEGSIGGIQAIGSTPHIPYLYKTPETIDLLLLTVPHRIGGSGTVLISIPEHLHEGTRSGRRSLTKSVDTINGLNIGAKLYLTASNPPQLGIINYTSHKELLELVQGLDLPGPTRDKVVQ